LQTSERTLDAPDILDDFYLNLLDWGSSNVVSIALENTVYLWNASDSSTSELVTVDDDDGPVTSVSWAPDGRHLAIGLNNSHVQLWDTTAGKQVNIIIMFRPRCLWCCMCCLFIIRKMQIHSGMHMGNNVLVFFYIAINSMPTIVEHREQYKQYHKKSIHILS